MWLSRASLRLVWPGVRGLAFWWPFASLIPRAALCMFDGAPSSVAGVNVARMWTDEMCVPTYVFNGERDTESSIGTSERA